MTFYFHLWVNVPANLTANLVFFVLLSFRTKNKSFMSCFCSVLSSPIYRGRNTVPEWSVCFAFIRSPCCRATQRSINRWPMKRWWWRTRSYLDLKGHLGLQVSFVDILLINLFNFSILFPTPLFFKPVYFCVSLGEPRAQRFLWSLRTNGATRHARS